MKEPDNFKDFLSSDQEIKAITDDSISQISASVGSILANPCVQSLNLFSSVSQREELANNVSEVVKSDDFVVEISDAIGTPFENETEEAFVARAKLVFKNRLRDKFS